ncbi:LamG domain-containing protein [Polymorphospora sp. NPDC051019]|uniref:LamG domain-containing protein n=1 Tax=Polymorphospora sp. NPDC051019 TaxID=3155725 RepID=UPI003431B2FF
MLPDVDLVGRATRTGFTHVLVVKTATAAANPAVRQLRYSLGGSVDVATDRNGGLRATADDVLIASAARALMWDSSTAIGGEHRSSEQDEGGPAGSSAAGPGDAAAVAPVAVSLDSGDLVLTPDTSLLGADAAYPVYVDPAWEVEQSKWAWASDPKGNNDNSSARVGRSPFDGRLYRSYFDFKLSGIAGAQVLGAYVQTNLDHSYACTPTPVSLWHTAGFTSPRTNWAPKMNKYLGSKNGNAAEGNGCNPQPDMTLNFMDPRVTALISSHASSRAAQVSVGLCACDENGTNEGVQGRWKRFIAGDTKLLVDYNWRPDTPHGLQTAGMACGSGPLSIGTMTPSLSAVFPDRNTTQSLTAAFEWLEVPSGGAYNDSTPRKPAPPSVSVVANGRAHSAALSGVQANKRYAWRARGTDPAPYNATSSWSPWCEFMIDTTAPVPPTISVVSSPGGPGEAGTFTLSTPESDVVSFRYGWTDLAAMSVTATGTSTKSATVIVVPPHYGLNTLYAYAIDATANKGNHETYEFIVNRPSPAVAEWGLETGRGTEETAALADRQPIRAGNTPLTATDLTWFNDARLMAGRSSSFNGFTTLATASGSALDTSKSFSVAAWLRVNDLDCSTNRTAVSADGVHVSAFFLGFECGQGKWWFRVADRDASDAGLVEVRAPVAAVPDHWNHVAASYDAVERRLKLYIDGVLVDEHSPSASWLASRGAGWDAGQIVVGRGRWSGNNAAFFAGQIAGVQLFDRVLVDQDFTGQLATDPGSGGFDEPGIVAPVHVGWWDFEEALSCYDPLIVECDVPDGTGWGRRLAFSKGAQANLGHRGTGMLLDSSHWIEDEADPNYGIATEEFGRSQRNAANTGQPPVWEDRPVLRTDGSFTVSAWVRLNDTATAQTVIAQDSTPGSYSGFTLGFRPDSGGQWVFSIRRNKNDDTRNSVAVAAAVDPTDWHHLVAVYDRSEKQVRLYVDGVLLDEAPMHAQFSPWHAAGPMLVGRGSSPTGPVDWLGGAVDDIYIYQGAMTQGGVASLNEQQLQ